jgi:hypothetical protein
LEKEASGIFVKFQYSHRNFSIGHEYSVNAIEIHFFTDKNALNLKLVNIFFDSNPKEGNQLS